MTDGLDLAKVHLKTIFAQVQTFLDMHQVVSAGPFLYTFVQEVCVYLFTLFDLTKMQYSSMQFCKSGQNLKSGQNYDWSQILARCAKNGQISAGAEIQYSPLLLLLLLLLLQPFNGLFSRTTSVSRHQKGRTILDFNDARDDGVAVASAGSYTNHLLLSPDR